MPTADTSGPPRRQVLWSAGVAPAPLMERVHAAAASGYELLSLTPLDFSQVLEAGVDPADVRQQAADQGVALGLLDGMIEWYEHEPPKRPLGGPPLDFDGFFAVADAFGCTSVNAIAPYPTALGIDDLAGDFARLCDRADAHGCRVHFEFTPASPISDVTTAAQLVSLAGRHNGGILFDTWHFFRVDPDFERLARVPGERIFAVQFSDGAAELEEGLLKDTFRHRRLPGEGDFDLLGVLGVLEAIGGLRLVGPEVLSVDLFALPVAEAARRAADSLDRLFAEYAARR